MFSPKSSTLQSLKKDRHAEFSQLKTEIKNWLMRCGLKEMEIDEIPDYQMSYLATLKASENRDVPFDYKLSEQLINQGLSYVPIINLMIKQHIRNKDILSCTLFKSSIHGPNKY